CRGSAQFSSCRREAPSAAGRRSPATNRLRLADSAGRRGRGGRSRLCSGDELTKRRGELVVSRAREGRESWLLETWTSVPVGLVSTLCAHPESGFGRRQPAPAHGGKEMRSCKRATLERSYIDGLDNCRARARTRVPRQPAAVRRVVCDRAAAAV